MVPCYPFKRDAIMDRFLVVMGILMAAFCYCLGWIAFLYDKSDPMSIPCLLMSHGLALITLLLMVSMYAFEMRSYAIDENGIIIGYGYGKLKKEFHSWDEITSICVCSYQMGTTSISCRDVIWCTFGDKYHDPRKLGSPWAFFQSHHALQTDTYHTVHARTAGRVPLVFPPGNPGLQEGIPSALRFLTSSIHKLQKVI